ncbi:MAG: N-6 DNA methylase [Cyclobacteriaceae bacterium]|nr:N-6 DNA methylase [Cyclobacteriaceae bacterium HetDA_MAG_MS6]
MTDEQLKKLEDDLWEAANNLRANSDLKSTEYASPVLGLIFLKYADNKYKAVEEEIKKELDAQKSSRRKRQEHEIAIEKCGFYLPYNARFDYLLHLPEEKSMAEALKTAMTGIEEHQEEKFKEVLPKDDFARLEKSNRTILPELLKAFSDIPEDAGGDVFGKIYEYFLGKFALSEGQKGGEFFTPPSVVKFIVEVIEPYHGRVYDPACGSGGMFVQSAEFIRKRRHGKAEDIYVEGQEKTGETVNLAKMNLMVNGLRGEIKQANSYAEDPFKSYGKFDYVMANPPFNVKTVKESTVKNDKRFYQYGLPKNKGKKEDKITDANYLWISLFATSLKEDGRAGFVIANSASDARNSEYDIRKKIVDSGMVDMMVTMPSNMFYTVTLPATLWFFDKGKIKTDRKDKILFLDARNVFRQIDRAHREWTEEQFLNLATIIRLHRGEEERFTELISSYLSKADEYISPSKSAGDKVVETLQSSIANLKKYVDDLTEKFSKAQIKKMNEYHWLERWNALNTLEIMPQVDLNELEKVFEQVKQTSTNVDQHQSARKLSEVVNYHSEWIALINNAKKSLEELLKWADKNLKVKNTKNWSDLMLGRAIKNIEEQVKAYTREKDLLAYFFENIQWMQKQFPDGKYADVVGLCKVADRSEYVDEQDYSLNPGRYVGVELEEHFISAEEFKSDISALNSDLHSLNESAHELEQLISSNLSILIDDD